jgi:hypothetical protein
VLKESGVAPTILLAGQRESHMMVCNNYAKAKISKDLFILV